MKATVLVAVDGQALGRTALDHALRLAGPDERIVLLRVVRVLLDPRDSYPAAECTEAEALSSLKTLGEGAGRELTYRLRTGQPAREIVAAAGEEGARLLVLATQGRTGLFRWASGSVAEHVARRAPCPVWLVLPGHAPGPVHKALLPLDQSPEAEESLLYARDFLAEGGEVVLLTAQDLLADPPGPEPLARHARRYLDQLVDKLRQVGVRASSTLADGAAAAAILRAADQEKADLIVMASHGRTGPARWVLGSVAEEVVRVSPCPVVVLGPRCRRSLVPETVA